MRILYFGPLKDITGIGEENLELSLRTRDDVLKYVATKYPDATDLLPSCAVTVDLVYVAPGDTGATVDDSSEVALIPPVSAG